MRTQYKKILSEGDKLINNKDFNKAIVCYTKAIELMPDNSEAYMYRGMALRDQGNLVEAAADFEKEAELSPYNEDTQRSAKKFRAKLEGDLETVELIETFERYLKSANDDTMFASTVTKEMILSAFENYDEALLINPLSGDAHFGRGCAYLMIKDIESAIADFNKALEINPEDLDSHLSRGWAHFKKGNYSKALSDAQRLLELDPDPFYSDDAQELVNEIEKVKKQKESKAIKGGQ